MPARSIGAAAHRVRQGIAALGARSGPADDDLAVATLPPRALALFRSLGAHDRAHALRVATAITTDGHPPPTTDLLAAALLHDAAKAGTPAVRGRVRLPDRVAKVLLGRYAPWLLARLASHPAVAPLRGLHLAVHHARLGADLAHRAGCPERVAWLVAHHEDANPSDPDLRRLVVADARSV